MTVLKIPFWFILVAKTVVQTNFCRPNSRDFLFVVH